MNDMHDVVKSDGIEVVTRPIGIEAYTRRGGGTSWRAVIETLKIMDATKCVKYDIKGAEKQRIQTIKQGIKSAAKRDNFIPEIKFAIKDNTLFIWSNK